MGQQSSTSGQQTTFEVRHWVQAVEDSTTSRFRNVNPNRKRLLMNKVTSQLIEQYQVQFFSQEDYYTFLSELQLRKESKNQQKIAIYQASDQPMNSSPYIYKIRHFRNLSVKEMCATIYNGLLYIDKVDLRLKEVNDVPFEDQLYLYKACLYGFKVLYEKVGYFEITEEMIFFDQNGHAKVWMNPNLSKFQPNYQPQYYNSAEYVQVQGSQSEMLKNFINIVQKNTDKQSIGNNKTFKDYLKESNIIDRLSFSKAIQSLEVYIRYYKLSVKSYMKSIYELFHYQQTNLEGSQAQKSQINVFHFKRQSDSIENLHQKRMPKKQQSLQSSQQLVKNAPPLVMNRNKQSKKSCCEMDFHNLVGGVKPESFNQNSHIVGPSPQINCYNSTVYNYNSLQMNFSSDNNSKLIPLNTKLLLEPKDERNPKSALIVNPYQGRQINFRTNHKINNSPTVEIPIMPRYKSLEKAPSFNPVGSSNKKITFSYQKHTPIIPTNHRKRYTEDVIIQNKKLQGKISDPKRKQSIIDRLVSPFCPQTLKTIEFISASKGFDRAEDLIDSVKTTNTIGKLNYYNSESEYMLDQEIAEDMAKYLGFNPNAS